jgi:hypothetical protein
MSPRQHQSNVATCHIINFFKKIFKKKKKIGPLGVASHPHGQMGVAQGAKAKRPKLIFPLSELL